MFANVLDAEDEVDRFPKRQGITGHGTLAGGLPMAARPGTGAVPLRLEVTMPLANLAVNRNRVAPTLLQVPVAARTPRGTPEGRNVRKR